jgi:cytochrome oxidase Cu insertion factor (SCO1/SenC/PrrC family)
MPFRSLVWGAALVVGIAGGLGIGAATQAPTEAAATIPRAFQVANPRLDPGTRLNSVAPDFKLTDQFGNTISLRHFRGKVVVLSFNDPQCTTICPLTTTALLEAKKLLGPAAAGVQLLGVGANPEATQVKWVRDYSQAHGMLHKWRFLTGSLPRLERVWQAYGVGAAVVQGAIDHTPATYVIDPTGRMTRLFLTNMSYSSVPQLAQVLARAIAADLPSHPHVRHVISLAPIRLIGPRQRISFSSIAGRTYWLGPGHGPHLVLFFNTWDPGIEANLKRLNRYAALTSVAPLIALDESIVETGDLNDLMYRVKPEGRVAYPVFNDSDGTIADGYGVQDSPWLTLVSGSGKILWRYDVAARGWPSTRSLVSHVHAAQAHAQG